MMKPRKNAEKKPMWRRRLFHAAGIVCIVILGVMIWYGHAPRWTVPKTERYPVRGIDVSHYQGDIDWEILADQGMQFAFIKATEGSSFVDARFAENWKKAELSGLYCGAYHFFSFDSPGETQAEHFIGTVGTLTGKLPPVIDVELYGDKFRSPPERAAVQPQLEAMIERLTATYGAAPILYSTQRAYNLYLKDAFEPCDIWIRDVYFQPKLRDNRKWTFWQYTDRGQLNGCTGEEKYIDINVFHGSEEEFAAYLDNRKISTP